MLESEWFLLLRKQNQRRDEITGWSRDLIEEMENDAATFKSFLQLGIIAHLKILMEVKDSRCIRLRMLSFYVEALKKVLN